MDRIIDIFFLHCPYAYDCQESTAYHRNDKMINTAKKSELKLILYSAFLYDLKNNVDRKWRLSSEFCIILQVI